MKLKIAIVALFAAIFIPYGVAFADEGIQYVWILQDSSATILSNGEDVNGFHQEDGQRVYNSVFGRVETDYFLDGTPQYACRGTVCAVGSFRYVKNPDLVFTSGSGVTFSNTVIREMDSRPMLAFSQSSVAFQAGISGYVDDPFIKAMVVTVIGISIAVYTMKSTWRILDVFKREDKDEETLQTSTNHSVYADDSVSDGHE